MSLVDLLPAELLVQILEDVGGRELRRGKGVGASRLTVCRKWYAAAHEIYLSGQNLTQVKVRGSTLNTLDTSLGYGAARPLMHKNTRHFKIRLHGHWWDPSKPRDANADAGEAGHNTLDEVGEDKFEYDDREIEPPLAFDPQSYRTDAGSISIKKWQDDELRPALATFFDDLGNFTALETLRFEVIREPELEMGPQWDYLHSSVLHKFVQHLPIAHDLTSLTLDTSGSALLADDTNNFHACQYLSSTIMSIPKVRLRLATVCPRLFVFDSNILTTQIRLKSLVLKLNQPNYPTSTHMQANECSHEETLWRRLNLHNIMIKAAQNYARRLTFGGVRKLGTLRISYIHPRTPLVQTVDCLTMRRLYYCQEDNFSYEDDGSPRWLEDSEFMREAEPYTLA